MDINLICLNSELANKNEKFLIDRDQFIKELNLNHNFNFVSSGMDVFFIASGGAENNFKKIYKKYSEPYIIVSSSAYNSLPASLEIVAFLKQNNKKCYLISGNAKEVSEGLLNINKSKEYSQNQIKNKINLLNNKRYGVIGKPSDWLIYSNVDYKLAKDKLGCELIDISLEELFEHINNAKEIIDDVVFQNLLNKDITISTLHDALKIYSALRVLIKKYNLNGITIRCFDMLDKYKNTSCLALALLNKDGYVATCEGDVPTMISMAIIKEVFHKSSFQANPSYVNLEGKYAYFAHCTLPLDMCLDYSFDTHFESGLGIGIVGRLNLGKVTIFKIDNKFENYEVYSGNITKNLNFKNLCRTQIKVDFCEDISSILQAPLGNHLVICYGDLKEEIDKIFSK